MPKVLLVDDNKDILSANKGCLAGLGYSIDCAETGAEALACLRRDQYDCVVLDVLLPDSDGFSVCKTARTITGTPILFLSCLDETDDKVKGLMAGGDYYMTKPYILRELSAQVQAIVRRGERSGDAAARGDFYIDRDNRLIHAHGKNVLLTWREFDMFMLFYENPGKSFSKEELLQLVWNGDAELNAVATLILRLRRKVEFAEDVIGKIVSEYGTGYHMVVPDKK